MTPTTIDKKSISLQCNLWTAGMMAIDNLCSMPWELQKMPQNEFIILEKLMNELCKQLPEHHDCPCELAVCLPIEQVMVLSKVSLWFEHNLKAVCNLLDETKRERILNKIAEMQQLNRRLNAYQNAYSSN